MNNFDTTQGDFWMTDTRWHWMNYSSSAAFTQMFIWRHLELEEEPPDDAGADTIGGVLRALRTGERDMRKNLNNAIKWGITMKRHGAVK
jgi:hypothetical protein